MDLPLDILFDGVNRSDAVEDRIKHEAEHLERFAKQIGQCHVAIRKPHRHKNKGGQFDVHIRITIPRKPDILVSHAPGDAGAHEDPLIAVRDAFHAVRRQLDDALRGPRPQGRSQ